MDLFLIAMVVHYKVTLESSVHCNSVVSAYKVSWHSHAFWRMICPEQDSVRFNELRMVPFKFSEKS